MALRHVSASQVVKFRRCQRRWSWEYVQGFKQGSTEKMRQGLAIHHALETYVNNGTILKEVFMNVKTGRPAPSGEKWLTARFVHAAIPLLPDRSTLTAEQRISLPTLGGEGPPWVGYIDAHNGISVIDYKTTGNLKFAKTAEDLLTDPQAVAYAWAVFCADDTIETVDATWLYLGTKNKHKVNTKKVTATFNRAGCAEQWDVCGETVAEMIEAAKLDTLALTPNSEACYDYYTACPHLSRCGADLHQIGGNKNMGNLLSQLEKSVANPGATPSNPPKAQQVLAPDAAPRETTPEEQAAFDEAQKPKTKAKKKKTVTKKSKGGMTIYVNCCPVKGDKEYELFETWIQPVIDRLNAFVSDEFKVDEFRLLEYSREKALFSKALKDHLDQHKPHALVMTMSSSYARDSLQLLCVHADQVIRSMVG